MSIIITNEVASATLDRSLGTVQTLSTGSDALAIAHDSWMVDINVSLVAQQNLSLHLSPGSCHLRRNTGGSQVQADEATFVWECATPGPPPAHRLPLAYGVSVTYSLRPNATFLTKSITVSSSNPFSAQGGGTFTVCRVSPFGPTLAFSPASSGGSSVSVTTQRNPYAKGLSIASFARWGAQRGAFFSAANPWASYTAVATNASWAAVDASWSSPHTHYPSDGADAAYVAEPAVLGLARLTKYDLEGINLGLSRAFKDCVESFHLDGASRAEAGGQTVKVNVAWDESDYQIDAGTAAGRAEYKRIIDRNAQLGVTHVVFEPRNTQTASRFNATDGWGWEGGLWFGMGERLRQGNWRPGEDALPDSIGEMVAYAQAKGVRLLAYVYPCLRFEAHPEAWRHGALDLSAPGVAEWLGDTLLAFVAATGAGGFAWDHDIFAPEGGGMRPAAYSQWRAWMAILRRLRRAYPDLVMDHRQTAHAWGPWYHLAGSYAEPLAGDENPETYGVRIASLHTDHVAADQLRAVNYAYAAKQLLPAARVPGFIFHQTERTADNGTNPCFGDEWRCFDNNTRDFDLLGYRYSLLSSIGTAGLNNVVCMIPARDPSEFALLPSADVAFVRDWLRWTDDHAATLRRTMPIANLPPPGLGSVDGTSAVAPDGSSGVVFLFNPGLRPLNATLVLDESVGLPNASSSSAAGVHWSASELYPRSGVPIGLWVQGERVEVTVAAGSARVIALAKGGWRAGAGRVQLAGLPGRAREKPTMAVAAAGGGGGGVLDWEGAAGIAHSTWTARILGAAGAPPPSLWRARVNGVECARPPPAATPSGAAPPPSAVRITFAGDAPVVKHAPLGIAPPGNTGGNFTFTFTIPAAVFAQLEARQRAYPIPWADAERNATWLIPSRLLASIFIAAPTDALSVRAAIDGTPLPVYRSYNSRGLVRPRVFLGFYLDLSEAQIAAGAAHVLDLALPTTLAPGAFEGVFLENVETEYVQEVAACALITV